MVRNLIQQQTQTLLPENNEIHTEWKFTTCLNNAPIVAYAKATGSSWTAYDVQQISGMRRGLNSEKT
eukprot:1768167-Amphidinium_carterae.1